MKILVNFIEIVSKRISNNFKVLKLLMIGVKIDKPSSIEIREKVFPQQNVKIGINVVFEGKVYLEPNVTIEDNCFLNNCRVKENSVIRSNSIVEGASIGADCTVGPYARIRPDTLIGNNSQIGNFVEIKNSSIGKNARINHLTYVGDSKVGDLVTIGAGSVTCNYDGASTQETVIEDDVFIGSGVFLVAPLKIGKGSTIGSGSVITEDTPEEKLTIARTKQITKNNWSRPKK